MSKGAAVTVTGADELAGSLHDLSGDLEHLEVPGGRAGQVVQVDARRRAPKRSGALAASIVVDVTDSGQSVTVTAGSGRVRYAGVQEGGWPARNIRPRWYLRGALQAQTDRVVELYAADITNKTDNVKGA